VAALSLTARAPFDGRTAKAATATPGRPGVPVTLALVAEGHVAMKGRVLDTQGKPVAGALIHLRRQERYVMGLVRGDAPVDLGRAHVLRTDAAGRFETPRGLDPDGEYSAIAETGAHATGQTPWTVASEGAFPDLVVRPEVAARLAALRGVVHDTAGRPVPGARVWASFPGGPLKPARVTTDAQGIFRLAGIPDTGALVFAEADEFRFQGAVANPAHSLLKLTLTRAGETAGRMTTLPPPLPWAEERTLGKQVIGPFADRLLKDKGTDEETIFDLLQVLVLVDPARVLEVNRARPFKQGPFVFNDILRRDAALALWPGSPEKALAAVESIKADGMRSSAFVALSDLLPATDRAGKLRLLDRALLAARAKAEPRDKVNAVLPIAEHWLDLGETDRATKLLREFEPVVRALPTQGPGGYTRGFFAQALSRIDLDAALKLIDGLGGDDQSRRLNIAQRLASRDPAAAERVLDGLKKPSSIVRDGARIVHAMAAKDPARARRIADRMNKYPEDVGYMPFHHAYALGMMALALTDTDKDAAKTLLDDANAELAVLAKEGKRGDPDSQEAATVAAALLPVAERIDPALVPERFWRAASWRGASAPMSRLELPKTMPDAVLALLLARYDREVARTLLEPLVAGGLSKPGTDANYTLQAMAAVDPKRAVALLDTVPDDPDSGLSPTRNPKNQARLKLTTALATPPEKRWDRALERLLNLWTVGRMDIF